MSIGNREGEGEIKLQHITDDFGFHPLDRIARM